MKRPSIAANEYALLKTLNSYTPRFQIKVRVVDKTPLTTFQNKRTNKPGSVFSCTIVDSEGTQMNCKFWNSAADKCFEPLQKGHVYVMSKGKIVVANKRFSNGIEHNYELSFDTSECELNEAENEESIPTERNIVYTNLRSIELSTKRLPFICNLVAIVHEMQPVRSVQVRTGETTDVRTIQVVDTTQYQMEISVWGHLASDTVCEVGDVIAVSGLQVKESKPRGPNASEASSLGKQASTVRSSEITVNQHPDTDQLRQWYLQHASATDFTHISFPMTGRQGFGSNTLETDLQGMHSRIAEGLPDEGLIFKIHAFISNVMYRNPREDQKLNLIYLACIQCNKKISDAGACPSCQGTQSTPKMSLSVALSDESASNVNVRVFSDVAQVLLGKMPQQMKEMIDEGNQDMNIKEICEYAPIWKRYTFIIRARKDLYNNQLRVNLSVGSATPYVPNAFAANAMKTINEFMPDIFEDLSNKRTIYSENQPEQNKRIKIDS
ncbi:putative replication factor A, related protein [Gregarina niphandrodes]|uniref:Replication factor A, related protein n=1 Tax=Gregarina niphandrodes TaxID=110365 RepID=A0A023B568_GRENI|nr:putative replication factor A, related protein [Gregarina niphandrodes]EZG58894.1 putative replication factor A, related protein [Gregarina niphandrodes]|eukprot:XP_011130925.1 putative replication factor A, related protein [Gregarina niphandrodes]